MEKRRVVITGMGVVAPNGIGIENFWDSLVHGRSAVRKITRFDASTYPCQVAAEVPNFDPNDYMDPKTAKRLSRFAQFALASAKMAVEDSGIDFSNEDPYKTGVYIGTAMGGADVIETQHTIFLEKGLKRISPFTVFSCSTHSASGIISCYFNLRGSNTTIAAGCNSGLDAAFLAFNAIRLEDADVMIMGASEAPITPYIHGAFCATGFLSRENKEPHKALKPFDANADGTVLGEGGAIVIMEDLQHALKRGARIYGEILAYSSLNEAFDFVEVDTNNETMALNFKQALERAALEIKDVDYINAHGNGMLSYDINETEAIKQVFGELAYNIPVTSIKPVTGQSFSTTGVYQLITSLLAINKSTIPPTINIDNPAPECDLNYVPNFFLKKEIKNVIINVHGFGGRITALIVKNFSPVKSMY
ncbi:MAG: beta-ketoacyl-[acyl-carrier-protein] synthase family protein [Thermodesulfobacteriota bacterium]